MKHILLCCAAGMSTSLLVTKMEEAAKNQGIEAEIKAVSVDEVESNIAKADVLLIGPQVRYMLSKLKPVAEKHNVPVDVINMVHYGSMNGKEVLFAALNLMKG